MIAGIIVIALLLVLVYGEFWIQYGPGWWKFWRKDKWL